MCAFEERALTSGVLVNRRGVALPSDSLRRIEASGPMYSQKEL